MLLSIDLRSLMYILPIYRDYIDIHLEIPDGLKKLSRDEISELMDKMQICDINWYCVQEEYFQNYHKKIKISIPDVEESKATDEINLQLHALAIFKGVGGENPIIDSPIPEHLAYLQSFYMPLVTNNQIHPDFIYEAKKIFQMKVTEEIKGFSNKVVLYSCLSPVKKLKLRASSFLWLARGFTEYKISLTPEKVVGALSCTEFHDCVIDTTVLKILVWNCRNAATYSFRQNFAQLVIAYSPSIVILTETRMHGPDATRIMSSLAFNGWAKVDSVALTGGIWILWKTATVMLKDFAHMHDEIHATIKIISEASASHQILSSSPGRE